MTGQALIIQGDALHLPLPDGSVDLCVTSPPYAFLRAYDTGYPHLEVGAEGTPAGFLEHLWQATAEMVRVLKPTGSIFVDLGDKYGGFQSQPGTKSGLPGIGKVYREQPYTREDTARGRQGRIPGTAPKSLMLLPERYRIGCVDRLGLIARAVIVWNKPNGLPEPVVDRVRRSHEDWVHLVKQPRYYSAIDEVREESKNPPGGWKSRSSPEYESKSSNGGQNHRTVASRGVWRNPLGKLPGKLPGSVWAIPSEPLRLPDHLGVQHYACVDEQTEILTVRGWLRHGELQAGDTVAGYNLDTGLAEWTDCRDVHRYQHDGPMVAVEKRDLSMRLTPNHRTVIVRAGKTQIVRADELRPTDAIPRAALWVDGEGEGIGESLAALCGWIAAEGWYGRTGPVYLSQSQTANPDKVAAVDKLLASIPELSRNAGDRGITLECGQYRARLKHQGRRWTVGRYPTIEQARAALLAERERFGIDGLHRTEAIRTWKGRQWVDVTWRLPRGLGQRIRELMPAKLLTTDLANLPLAEARALFESFVDGDGHRRPAHLRAAGRISIYQKDRVNLDLLQMVAVRLGYRTILTEDRGRFVLYCNEARRPLTLRNAGGRCDPIPTEHYRGIVWCPTTGTGTMICRRRGRVFITAQSFPSEWPRRLILGWSPPGICLDCEQGRVPVVERRSHLEQDGKTCGRCGKDHGRTRHDPHPQRDGDQYMAGQLWSGQFACTEATILGYACACTPHTNHPGSEGTRVKGTHPSNIQANPGGGVANYERHGPWREYHLDGWRPPPTRPAVVLDPFSGVGTTIGVARRLGRIGIGVDLSHSYCRAAKWRVFNSESFGKAQSRTWVGRQGSLL